MSAERHTHELLEKGFTVFERAWPEDEVHTIREIVRERFERTRPEPTWSVKDIVLDDAVTISYTGVVFYRLVRERPELAQLLLKPLVIDALRGVLGEDMTLELVGGVVSDETRPFFSWHTHIGGFEDHVYQSQGGWPVVKTIDRITTLLYLDDVDDDGGLLLLYPRQVGDPLAPPADPGVEPWPGQAEMRIPRGSLVAFDQCTWHTARPQTRPGLRIFLGCSFRAPRLDAPDWEDRGLREAAGLDPLLASVLR